MQLCANWNVTHIVSSLNIPAPMCRVPPAIPGSQIVEPPTKAGSWRFRSDFQPSYSQFGILYDRNYPTGTAAVSDVFVNASTSFSSILSACPYPVHKPATTNRSCLSVRASKVTPVTFTMAKRCEHSAQSRRGEIFGMGNLTSFGLLRKSPRHHGRRPSRRRVP